MNDIARPPLAKANGAASATPTSLTIESPPGPAADLSGTDVSRTDDDRPVRLTWRRLDRLASAARLGMILAAPRSVLLEARLLGPQVLRSTSPSAKDPRAAAHRQAVR